MSRFYIGIDGGGTHTRTLVADANGRIVGEGKAGSTNRNHHTRDEVRANMLAALLQASGGKSIGADATIFLGMCGVSNDADRNDITSIAREIPEIAVSTKIIVDNDAVIGLAGGLSGRPGIVLIAGTGSACLGIDAHGHSYWCGGWGAMADDCGSAHRGSGCVRCKQRFALRMDASGRQRRATLFLISLNSNIRGS